MITEMLRKPLAILTHDRRILIRNCVKVTRSNNFTGQCAPRCLSSTYDARRTHAFHVEQSSRRIARNNHYTSSCKTILKKSPYYGNNNIFTRTTVLDCDHTVSNGIKRHASTFGENQMANNTTFGMISQSMPVEYVQNFLISVHNYIGLPWWATILLTTIGIRTIVTLPLTVYQHHITAKLHNLKYELEDIALGVQRTMRIERGDPIGQMKMRIAMKEEWRKLVIRDNCHPAKTFILALVQIPLWISTSFALRNMCYMLPVPDESARQVYAQLANDGAIWLVNLTQYDNFFVLPILFGVSGLALIEIQSMMRMKQTSKFDQYYSYFCRGLILCITPIIAVTPAGLSLFWVTSNFFGIGQHLLVLSPRFRRLVRIPDTEVELEKPYTRLRDLIKSRFTRNAKKAPLTKV